MRAFRFRLERVLTWRGTELTLAEAKAEQLLSSLRATQEAIAQLAVRRASAHAIVGGAALISGADLSRLESARIWAIREAQKLAARKFELEQAIDAQNRRVAEARRAVKLVERLKERQHGKWKAEADHEIEELAGESAIAQWRRLHY